MKTIEQIYGNLTAKKSDLTTLTDFYNGDRKVMSIGSNPYHNWYKDNISVFVYWWDFISTKMKYEDFQNELITFVNSIYNCKVTNVNFRYVGIEQPLEIGEY